MQCVLVCLKIRKYGKCATFNNVIYEWDDRYCTESHECSVHHLLCDFWDRESSMQLIMSDNTFELCVVLLCALTVNGELTGYG